MMPPFIKMRSNHSYFSCSISLKYIPSFQLIHHWIPYHIRFAHSDKNTRDFLIYFNPLFYLPEFCWSWYIFLLVCLHFYTICLIVSFYSNHSHHSFCYLFPFNRALKSFCIFFFPTSEVISSLSNSPLKTASLNRIYDSPSAVVSTPAVAPDID